MKRFTVITIGSATRDVFMRSRGIRVIHDEHSPTGEAEELALGAKIEVDELVFETGGGATNTAVGFARQGFRTAFVGKIGATDVRGQEILKALEVEGVDQSLVVRDNRRQSGYSVLLLTPRGERTALVYRGASADFQPADFPWTQMQSRWLYVTSIGGNLAVLRDIWDHAQRHGQKIMWNPGAKELEHGLTKLLPWLAATDVLMVNNEEAGQLTKFGLGQDLECFHRLRTLVRGLTIITQGTEGSLGGNATVGWHCGTNRVNVVDTTGAGDAFGCGFLGEWMRQEDVGRALQFATTNSESVIQQIGAKKGLLKRVPSSLPPLRQI